MISVYKFQNFNVNIISSEVLDDTGKVNGTIRVFENHFILPYMYRRNYNRVIVPVSKKVINSLNKESSPTEKININHLLNTVDNFTFNDKVYLHSNCSIPRAKVTQKYTRVLKPEKADICVVPKLERGLNTENISIFINKSKCRIFILINQSYWNNNKISKHTSDKCSNFPLESSILDINPYLKDSFIKNPAYYGYGDTSPYINTEEWKDFLGSILLYYGPILSLDKKETWIADLLYNNLHDVITEDRILDTLGDSTNKFTKEVYDNLGEMLISPDKTIVGLGLKTIAEMDHEKYSNTTIHLLTNNKGNWARNDMRSNTSVKYMLNYLGLGKAYIEKYFHTTTQEDFVLMQEVIESDFRKQIETAQKRFNSRFPFAKLCFSYQFEVFPKLEKDTENFEEDCGYNNV